MLMTADPIHDWVIPPTEGFTADDLDRIPDLPRHTQLIDGSLVFVSPQAAFHYVAINLLNKRLEEQAPPRFLVAREMTITLGRTQRPEPDLMIVHAAAFRDLDQTDFARDDAVLTIEVVSPDSRDRDRVRKPLLYAEAGIQHFWRVERDDDHAVVYVYELDPATHAYALSGIHRERLEISAPFPVDIDLTEINRFGQH